jgi:hypothetical protein
MGCQRGNHWGWSEWMILCRSWNSEWNLALFECCIGRHISTSRGCLSIRKVNTVILAVAKARGDGLLGFVVCGSHVPWQSQSELLSISITFETLLYWGSTKDFWESFSKAIDLAIAGCGRGLPTGPREWQGYTQGVQKGRGKVTVIHTLVIPPPMSRVCRGTRGSNFSHWMAPLYMQLSHE